MFLIPAGLAFVIVLFGGIMAGVGHYRAQRDVAALSWPSTEATVITSVQTEIRERGVARPHSMVSYRYQVAGREYEFRTSGSTPEGTRVMLRYDPEDPSDNRFPNQEPESPTGFYLVGLGSALLTLPFWYLAKRWYSSARVAAA